MRQDSYDLRHRRHLQRGPNDKNQVHKVPVMIHQPVMESGR